MRKTIQKQHFLCLVFACLMFHSAIAQKNWTVEWGKVYEHDKKEGNIVKILASDAGGFYVLRSTGALGKGASPGVIVLNPFVSKKQSAWIDYYDFKFKKLKSVAIGLTYNKEELELEDVIVFGDKLYVLTSFFNKKQEKSFLFAQQVDVPNLSISSEYAKLTEFSITNKYRGASYDIQYSADSSKILIHAGLVIQKGDKEQYTLSVWDKGLVKSWEKSVTLPYPENDIVVKSFSVDNNGTAYIVASRDRSRKEKNDRQEYDTDYYVFAWSKLGQVFKEYKAALEKKYISGFNLVLLDTGDLACAGLYSDEEEGYVKGAFFYRINPETGTVSHKNLQAFSFEVRAEDLSERKQEKAREKESQKQKERELVSYKLDGMFVRPDGNVMVIGEQNYTTTSQSYDGKSWRTYTVFHYDDLVLANFTPEGQLLWSSLLKKKQTSFSGYLLAAINSKMHVVYKNDKKDDSVQMASVTDDGKIDYNYITANDEYNLDARVCELVDANTIIIHTSTRKDHRFGKIIFNN